jgi:hypothetical protein
MMLSSIYNFGAIASVSVEMQQICTMLGSDNTDTGVRLGGLSRANYHAARNLYESTLASVVSMVEQAVRNGSLTTPPILPANATAEATCWEATIR